MFVQGVSSGLHGEILPWRDPVKVIKRLKERGLRQRMIRAIRYTCVGEVLDEMVGRQESAKIMRAINDRAAPIIEEYERRCGQCP